MNEGESAGERPNIIGFTPAVMNRRLIPNPSANLVTPVRMDAFCIFMSLDTGAYYAHFPLNA